MVATRIVVRELFGRSVESNVTATILLIACRIHTTWTVSDVRTDDPSLDARLTYKRRQSDVDPRAALFVLSPVSQAEIGDFVRRYVPPPPIRHQYAHTTHAACRTRCTSRRWSTTPTTRSALGGSAIGTRRRPRINFRCLPWLARESRDRSVPRDGPSGTSTRWRVSRSSVGRTRLLSSKPLPDCLCLIAQWMESRHYQDAYAILLIMFGSTAILPSRAGRKRRCSQTAST